MGPVTMAAAAPAMQAVTDCSIADVTDFAFPGDGRPGIALTVSPVSRTAFCTAVKSQPSCAAASRKQAKLPTRRIGRSPIVPFRRSHDFNAISGPIPDGSPWVTRMGPRPVARSPCFDNGIPPEIAQIALAQDRHLLDEELLLQLIARGKLKRDQLRRRRVATHDDLQTRLRIERINHFTSVGLQK